MLRFGLEVKPVLEGLTGETPQQPLGEVVEEVELAHLQAYPSLEEGCPVPSLLRCSAVTSRRGDPKRRNKSHNFMKSEHSPHLQAPDCSGQSQFFTEGNGSEIKCLPWRSLVETLDFYINFICFYRRGRWIKLT